MSGEPLDASTGMPRTEIKTTLELEVTKAKESLREETRRELQMLRNDVSSIKDSQKDLRHEVKNLQQGQVDINGRVGALEAAVKSGFESLSAQIKELDIETATITEETEDGRKITKHFRNWSTVAKDIKRFWPHATALFCIYKLVSGWFAAHGITWSTIWAK